jgi:hypothetical protein
MPFDFNYAVGSYIALPTHFIRSGSLTYNPDNRDDTRNLGRKESDHVRQSINFLDSRVQDFGISWRYGGNAGRGIVTAIVQGPTSAPGTISMTEKEFDNIDVARPRSYITIKGLNKKLQTLTPSGPEMSIWAPSDAIMGSMAVIIDSVAVSKVRSFSFTLLRVENTGAALAAGQAVKYDTGGLGPGGMTRVVACTGAGGEDFVGILAEDVGTNEVGGCYAGLAGAALIPNTIGGASAAAIQGPAYLAAAGALAAAGTQRIGTWKHVPGSTGAYILVLGLE